MNQTEQLIPNKYIVDESIIDEYIQKKNTLMCKRNINAGLNIQVCIMEILLLIYYFV